LPDGVTTLKADCPSHVSEASAPNAGGGTKIRIERAIKAIRVGMRVMAASLQACRLKSAILLPSEQVRLDRSHPVKEQDAVQVVHLVPDRDRLKTWWGALRKK
jgi:hypothetical protein